MKKVEIIDEKLLIWKEFKSQKGVSYSVGYFEEEIEHIEKMILDTSSSMLQTTNEVDVHWEVLNDSWKVPKKAVKDAGISRYDLHINGDGKGIWSFRLDISNTKTRTYYFTDESGDTYKLWCYWHRNHYVRYNSPYPTIVRVSW